MGDVDGDVRNLIGRYCDAVLRADPERFGATWHRDAEWVLPGTGTVEGRAGIVELFDRMRAGYRRCVQEVLSGVVEPDGPDAARGDWQVRELQWRVDGSASELIGVYHDRVVRDDDGRMRFVRREFELVYSGPLELPGRLWDLG